MIQSLFRPGIVVFATVLLGLLLASSTSTLVAQSADSTTPPGTMVHGTTVPNERRELGYDIRGMIRKVLVEKGDFVQEGQVLVELDDAEQRARFEALELQADPTLAVKAAIAERDLRLAQYQRAEENFNQRVANEIELKEAQAQLRIAEVRVEQAEHEGRINAAQARSQKAVLDRMQLRSTIAGYVSEILRRDGEIVDESRHVVEVVGIDPLYIEVRLADFDRVRLLAVNQKLKVRFKDGPWVDATINYISPTGDARAGSRPFRLEVSNKPDAQGRQRPPGELVEVMLPPVALTQARD